MSRLPKQLLLIYAAAFLRAVCVGTTGVVLGLHLAEAGLDAVRVGAVIGLGLAGGAAGTLLVGLLASRVGQRRMLLGIAGLTALGGGAFATGGSFWLFGAGAFFGMVNGMGKDRAAAYSLEQVVIPEFVTAEERTRAFALYNVLLSTGQAVGSLLAVLPHWLRASAGIEALASYRWLFVIYIVLSLGTLFLYSLLPETAKEPEAPARSARRRLSPESRRTVGRFAGLNAFDALAGGFLTGALISYWFFRRFGVDEQTLAPLFFSAHVLNALSNFGAAWLARRIGLINTMVFTHIPSSLLLMAVPFAPNLGIAVLLYLLRESTAQMDVPTRQSYIVAVVRPEERPMAVAVTNLSRNFAWAVGSPLAGAAMRVLALSAPLFIGGTMKIAYDLLLFRSFRRIKPPEEQVRDLPVPESDSRQE